MQNSEFFVHDSIVRLHFYQIFSSLDSYKFLKTNFSWLAVKRRQDRIQRSWWGWRWDDLIKSRYYWWLVWRYYDQLFLRIHQGVRISSLSKFSHNYSVADISIILWLGFMPSKIYFILLGISSRHFYLA